MVRVVSLPPVQRQRFFFFIIIFSHLTLKLQLFNYIFLDLVFIFLISIYLI